MNHCVDLATPTTGWVIHAYFFNCRSIISFVDKGSFVEQLAHAHGRRRGSGIRGESCKWQASFLAVSAPLAN
jgi:hypothetical protein